tara:strand:+ start:203 stop:763 length:561 start_codon:yes stop_codon:yes gene_type:complete
MNIQQQINDLIFSNDRYKCLRDMLKFKSHNLRKREMDIDTVKYNLNKALNLNILKPWTVWKPWDSNCRHELDISDNAFSLYNTQHSENGCAYYPMIVRSLIILIIFEYITNHDLISKELKSLDDEENGFLDITYKKLCECVKEYEGCENFANLDDSLRDSKEEVVNHFKNSVKRFRLCKKLFELSV